MSKRQDGFVAVYMAVLLTGLLLFTGLAVDSGRAYVVKAQLTKAVDGAALGAARNLNGGDPKGEATRIFKANFPPGYFDTTGVTDPTTDPNFFSMTTDAATGVNTVTVTATAVVPTTFMRLGKIMNVKVSSSGEATRRMVDLSLVLDGSSSIGTQWGAVRDASRAFINSFDAKNDRVALSWFGNGAAVLDQMPSARGFNKTKVVTDVPQNLPNGSTNMVEGLYRAWDEIRSVPAGTQSGLRVIVLFTDGASNSVPGFWDSATVAKGVRTFDFPQNPGDTHGQTHNQPHITGAYDTQSGTGGDFDIAVQYDSTTVPTALPTWAKTLPAVSAHTHHRSSGIPTAFPLLSNTLKVEGTTQSAARPLRNMASGKYPSEIFNINNAARNLVEIIADTARNDTSGDYKIRIYTIGMGELVRLNLGTRLETSESMLMRIANDRRSKKDFNANQLEGKYFYAETAADVAAAFAGIQNQILRLSK
jgi:Flp pilus assembly protein TadG